MLPKNKILRYLSVLLPAFFISSFAGAESGISSDQSTNVASDSITQSLPDSSNVIALESMGIIDSSTIGVFPDTVILEPILYNYSADTILTNVYRSENEKNLSFPSPTVALFKSVLFPGWGQYSNRRFIKMGIVMVVESYFIFRLVEDAREASKWRDRWREADNDILKIEYFNKYAGYRDDRNTNMWYTALVIFISMFDAYVDAHLRSFPDKVTKPEDITFKIDPGEQTRITLNYNF